MISLAAGLAFTACEEDNDYTIYTEPVVTASSVTTGGADVTAVSATLYGKVAGVDGMSAAAYTVGFYYGTDQNNMVESVNATYANGDIVATIEDLTANTTIYYQAFVQLQKKVVYRGAVNSLVTSNARATTGTATEITFSQATLSGTLADYPEGATCGVVLATAAEGVRDGLIVPAEKLEGNFELVLKGLLPATTYYYAAYLNVGTGIVYGDAQSFTTAAYDFDLDNDLVDLGLSVKWARFNVGASTETEAGGLFGFGDLTGCNNSTNVADYASADTYRTAQDLVYNAYQGRAMLPSAADFEELFALCSKEWTEVDGVEGYKLTGPNGNSIFLPAAGSRTGNVVKGAGTTGLYQTGSINTGNTQFAVTYQFNGSTGNKTTTAVYEAVSVRAVAPAGARNAVFDKALLYQKWVLDNGQDGKQHLFQGPFTQYGATDNWATVSNGQPNIEQQIYWEMGTDNGWIGYTYGVDYGYMEFKEDGTVNIQRKADDGSITEEVTGTYSIDEENKVLDIDIDVLCANTWVPIKSGKLNILSLTEEGLQIAIRENDVYAYALNYYSVK